MFSQELAEKNAARDDIYYVVAHLIRSVSALNQVLFALNEQYFLTDKGAIDQLNSFRLIPAGYVKIINPHPGSPGLKSERNERNTSSRILKNLWKS